MRVARALCRLVADGGQALGLALALVALVALVAPVGAAQAQEPQPVPPLTARVIDRTGTLPADRIAALEGRLAAFEAQSGPQIVVLMVPSTLPEDIASYAQRVGEAWKLGRREVGDGLLMVIAKDDRRIWLATSKALEGAIPDLAARQIIRDAITPAFKRGDFAGGIEAGLDRIVERLRGEALPAPRQPSAGTAADGLDWAEHLQDLALFFFVAVPVISLVLTGIFGRRLGGLLTSGAAGGIGWLVTGSVGVAVAAGVVAFVVVGILGIGALLRGASGGLSSGGRGRSLPSGPVIWGGGHGGFDGGFGGGGSSGGGGGFSSGGGGDFGGGGAGGDW